MSHSFWVPGYDAGDFHIVVARYVKQLILARLVVEPAWLGSELLAGWDVSVRDAQRYPAWRLMEMAAGSLAKINTDFIERCGSGGRSPI